MALKIELWDTIVENNKTRAIAYFKPSLAFKNYVDNNRNYNLPVTIKGTQKPYNGLQYVTIDQSSKPTRNFSQYLSTHVPKCKPPFLNEETYYVAILPLLTDIPKDNGTISHILEEENPEEHLKEELAREDHKGDDRHKGHHKDHHKGHKGMGMTEIGISTVVILLLLFISFGGGWILTKK
jgi:hypothetical protein